MGKQETPNDREMTYIIPPAPGYISHACKELTQAVRIQQRTLQEKLQSCLDELRQICLHEAELTGVLPKEFPLKPGETPPKIRRRVGALFKLDERTVNYHGVDPVGCLERDLALQRQITEAARRLYLEESLSKQVRHQRKAALKAAEQKLLALEDKLSLERSQENLHLEDISSVSETSSLSDVTSLEKDDSLRGVQTLTSAGRPLPPQTLEGLCALRIENDNQKSPLQNSPWKESSLDLPYEKQERRLNNSQRHSSPAATPLPSPEKPPTESGGLAFVENLDVQNNTESSNKNSVTHSIIVQSLHGSSDIQDRALCRRATSFCSPSNTVYTLSLLHPMSTTSNPVCSFLSPDSLPDSSRLPPSYNLAYCPVTPKGEMILVPRTPSVTHSITPSKPDVTEELRFWHVRAQMKEANAPRPRSLDRKGAVRLHSGQTQSHIGRSLTQRMQISPRHVLRRTAEGVPLQWYDPEEAQIISQV